MGKGKRKEKQTTKLKVGRKLPKGENVVNPTFKMKKMKIGDKKFNPFDDTPKPKFEINEAFKILDEKSPNEKVKLLKTIKNLITNGDIVMPDIIRIFHKILELMVAPYSGVREQVLVVMKLILQKFSEVKQEPNVFLIEKWISCSMTSPYDNVRYDSIKFLQLILNKLPNTLSYYHSLFEKLLNLISFVKTTDKPVRTLLISPSSRTGTMEWRETVLKCLLTFIGQNAISESPKPFINKATITVGGKDVYKLAKYVNPNSVHLNEYMLDISNPVNFWCAFGRFEAFIAELMPVLYGSFIECIPSGDDSISFSISNMMFTILQIVQHLAKWLIVMPCEELKILLYSKYNDEIVDKFFTNFPYSEDNVHPSFVFKINHILCNIFSLVILQGSYPPMLDEKICHYIHTKLMVEKNRIYILSEILPILEIMLQSEKKVEIFTPLLNQLLTLCFKLPPNIECQKQITSFFMKLSIDIDLYHHLHLNSVLNDWWKYLPVAFIALANQDFDENNQKLFETVLRVCDRDYSFLCTLREPETLNCILELAVSEKPTVRTTALKFLTKLNPITVDCFKRIINVLRTNNAHQMTPYSTEQFLLDLAMRYSLDKSSSGFNIKDFVCFLMNLIFEPAFREDAFGDNVRETSLVYLDDYIPFKLTSYNVVSDHASRFENDITNFVISLLCDLPDKVYVASLVQQYLNLFLQQCDKISAYFAVVVLKFGHRFLPRSVPMVSDELMLNIGDLMIGLYLYCIAIQTACHDNPKLNVDWKKAFETLKKYTFNVGYALKVVMNQMEEINSVNYLFCVGQLLHQMFFTLELRNVDFVELHKFLRLLKNKFGKAVTKEKWWPRIRKWSQLAVLNE